MPSGTAIVAVLLTIAVTSAIGCTITWLWWQAAMRRSRWAWLWPVMSLPTIFGPWIASSAVVQLVMPPLTSDKKFVVGMLCIIPVLIVSIIGSRRYQAAHARTTRRNV